MAELPRPLPPPSLRDRLEGWREWRDRLPSGALAGAVAVLVIVVVIGGLFALFAGGGVGRWQTSTGTDVALSLPKAVPEASDTPSTTAATELRVHAAGAVVQPGVVTVPKGARVADVVAAAGGPSPDADLDQVNLAAPVADGERVYVPHHGEVGVAAATASGASKPADAIVNINQADETQLESLPGVGPATAKAIVEYRNEHGRFRSVDDLLNVRGIGPSKLSQIKPHARV